MLRPCLDCGMLTSGSRCPPHQTVFSRQRDARRGSRQQRGYDQDWVRLSKAAIAAEPWCHRLGGCRFLADAGTPANPWSTDHIKPGSLVLGVTVLCMKDNASKRDRQR